MIPVIYLDLSDLLYVARRAIGTEPEIRDVGLLESALARPKASAFGADAYESICLKAAALAHSLARNHALVDGNKTLTLGAVIAFLGINGRRLTGTNDDAYEFVIALAEGGLDDIHLIADRLEQATEPRA